MNLTGIDDASSALIAQAVEALCVAGNISARDEEGREIVLNLVLSIYQLGVTDGKIAGTDKAIAGMEKLLKKHFPEHHEAAS